MRGFVVSANYFERNSVFRWLIRRADEHPTEAIGCRRVDLRDVAFCPSSAYEDGFGCKVIAEASDAKPMRHAIAEESRESWRALEFSANRFVLIGTSIGIDGAERLRLLSDGTILARGLMYHNESDRPEVESTTEEQQTPAESAA